MRFWISVFGVGMFALAVGPLYGATVEGIEFKDRWAAPVDGKTLTLNGTALRTAIFGVRVYAAGLYVPAKTQDGPALIQSKDPKVMRMVFLRDVDAEKIAGTWVEAFEKTCAKDCAAYKEPMEKFKAGFASVKKGDALVYRLSADKVDLALNDRPLVSVAASGFGSHVLATWVGEHPPSEEFRDGLLGKTKP